MSDHRVWKIAHEKGLDVPAAKNGKRSSAQHLHRKVVGTAAAVLLECRLPSPLITASVFSLLSPSAFSSLVCDAVAVRRTESYRRSGLDARVPC